MLSLNQFILLATLCVVAFAENPETEQPIPEAEENRTIVFNVSATFDKLLPAIRQYIVKNGLDPMELPDMEVVLSPIPGLVNSKMHLHHGYLQQLSTIYRFGDIMVLWNRNNVSLYVNIGFETLDLSHEYTLKFMFFNRRGDIYTRYQDVQASLLIDFDFNAHNATLRFFKLMGFGEFKIKLEGNFADKFFNMIINTLTKIFKNQMIRVIESTASEEIQGQLDALTKGIVSFEQTFVDELLRQRALKKYLQNNTDPGILCN